MPIDPSDPTLAQCEAIGALTYDAGVSAKMDYAAKGSGAKVYDMKNAFLSTFKYSNAIVGDRGGNNIGAGLLAMINPNLDALTPVILVIRGASSAHAVVCDGYGYNVSTLYHHLNLGWGGTCTAWYSLPTIEAGATIYTNVYACIYNLYTNGTGEIVSGRVTSTNGAPVSGATVDATRSAGGKYQTTTGPNGIFALAKLPSSSQYTFTVSQPGYAPLVTFYSTGKSTNRTGTSGNRWGADFVLVPTNAAPLITSQPQERAAMRGARTTFSAVVIGSAPLKYCWLKNGQRLTDGGSISGSATPTLTLGDVTAAESASYCLLATNDYGTATSASARLTVYGATPPFVLGFDDLFCGTNSLPIPAGHRGFLWDNFYATDALSGASGPSGYQVGMVSPNNVAFNAYGRPASISSTGLFNFISAHFTAGWNDNLALQIRGYADGKLAYSDEFILSASTREFTSLNYVGIQEVEFISSGGTLHPGYTHTEPAEQFVLDDLTLQTSAGALVPPSIQLITADNGEIMLRWQAVAGQSYQVQYTSDLARFEWNTLGGAIIATNDTASASDAVGPSTQRWYRVILLP